MSAFVVVSVFVLGALLGGAAVYMALRQLIPAKAAQASAAAAGEARAATLRGDDLALRLSGVDVQLRGKETELRALDSELTRLKTERATFETRLEELGRIHDRMKDAFASLSAEALKSTNDTLLQIAKRELEGVRSISQRDLEDKEKAFASLISPIREGLSKYDAKLEQLAKERDETFGLLTGQLRRVEQASVDLGQQTQLLSRALRSPSVRGRWGEMQLRRVIEVAGMLEHCDFDSQKFLEDGENHARPDVVIKLPGGRAVAVDAKVPLTGYLESLEETTDDGRKLKLKHHASQLRGHSNALGKKQYWEKLDESPEFVVLFLPSEVFFSAALEQDPMLLEESFTNNRVIIATPTTLIALLQAVAYGWRQESIARNAAEIAELGRELYDRLCKFDDHIGDLGNHLEKAMKFYNSAVGTLESRVLVSARRFKELGVAGSVGDLAVLEPLETPARALRSTELTDGVS
ncbi:MAG: DNA recombination protein RmuC [Gemmatimonadaceae bacterium]|nr:DNA recombination protein RmuC [Gemmatimonadaceae bacterium]